MPKKLDHTAAIEHLSRVDKKLAKIIAKAGPCYMQPETTQSLFESLMEAIIYQQLNGKVAATITARVKALFPEEPHRIKTRHGVQAAFPSPEQVLAATPELLRSAGLSQNKMLAIRDLAAKALNGTVPSVRGAHKLSDDALVEHLTSVRGIGRWTVEMLLIFRLGRPDVLAVDDYGVRKGFAKMHRLDELPKPKELQALRGEVASVPLGGVLVPMAGGGDERTAGTGREGEEGGEENCDVQKEKRAAETGLEPGTSMPERRKSKTSGAKARFIRRFGTTEVVP